MFTFFQGIASMITTIVDFVISLFNMLFIVIAQIPQALTFIGTAVAYLPDFVKVFVLLFVGTCVAINLINLGG